MKFKLLIFSLLFLQLLFSKLCSEDVTKLDDIFGLELVVKAPFPDTDESDGIEMDTVRFGHYIEIFIYFTNRTETTKENFQITAFFPNRSESFTKFQQSDKNPAEIDSNRFARWDFGTIVPEQSGCIYFVLKAVKPADEDTVYLSYGVAAQATGSLVSEKSHTNIYIPGGNELPDLTLLKTTDIADMYSGDIVEFKIEFRNQGRNNNPAANAVICDTLPSSFTFIRSNHPAEFAFSTQLLSDQRTVLKWEINRPIYFGENLMISYFARAQVDSSGDMSVCNLAGIESQTDEYDTENNRHFACVLISPSIDLVLESQAATTLFLNNGEHCTFSLRCTNNSNIPIPKAELKLMMDDGVPGKNIYTVIPGDNGVLNNEVITWEMLNFDTTQTVEKSVELRLDQISEMQNYDISFNAVIDTAVQLTDRIHADKNPSNNYDDWIVYVDATPDLEVSIREQNNTTSCLPDAALNFFVSCKNNSNQTIGTNQLVVALNDQLAEANLYSLSIENGCVNANQDSIAWLFGPLQQAEELNFTFQVVFDRITNYGSYELNLTAATDLPLTDDDNPNNNRDSMRIAIDATPELLIDLTEINNKYLVEPDETLQFKITASNTSVTIDNDMLVSLKIIGEKIYTLSSSDGQISDGDTVQITWSLTQLAAATPFERFVNLTFDKITQPQNQTLRLVAAIICPGINEAWASDSQEKTISTNVNVEVAIDQLSLNTPNPKLNSNIEYQLQISNRGNFPAHNARLSIEKPQFSYLNYYSLNGNRYTVPDSTTTAFEISLGDLDQAEQLAIAAGLRIFSYKELQNFSDDHFTLTFKASVGYDGGPEIYKEISRTIYFDPAVSKFYFDKNIVEPGHLPLLLTFESGGNGELDIKVFNLAGEFIKKIYSGTVERGDIYTYEWNADNEGREPVSSGVYFIHANTKFFRDYKKVIIVR